MDPARLDHLLDVYGPPGGFAASIAWYRASTGTVALSVAEEDTPSPAGRISTPTTVLWPEQDVLFPPSWADRLDRYFADYRVRFVDNAGHFARVEYPETSAEQIRLAADSSR